MSKDNLISATRQHSVGHHLLVDELYRCYWNELSRYIRGKFGSGPPDPEDVTQQAFFNLAQAADLSTILDHRAYLRRAAVNIAIDERRRLQVRETIAPAENSFDDLNPERVLLGKEAHAVAYKTIEAMPRFRRRVLILNRIHGLSAAEIARRMGKPETTVRSAIARALEELQHAMNRLTK